VWIDKPTKKETYKRIMAAVDARDDNLLELNRLILDLTTSLAAIENSEAHVVHAWRLPGESLLRHGRANVPKQQVDELTGLIHEEHRHKLDVLVRPDDLSTSARVHLVKKAGLLK
jgi:universal stress protein E